MALLDATVVAFNFVVHGVVVVVVNIIVVTLLIVTGHITFRCGQ